MATKANEPSIDLDALTEALGGFGRYQKMLFLLTSFPAMLTGMAVVNAIFAAYNVEHRCLIPSCESSDSSPLYNETFLNFTTPFLEKKNIWSQCNAYIFEGSSNDSCRSDDFDMDEKDNCTQWVYNKEIFSSTMVSEFDLVCGSASMVPLSGSILMLGMLIGAITIGDFADRYGRKAGIILTCLMIATSGLVTAFAPNYTTVLILRACLGAGTIGLFQVAFVLAIEFVGSDYRTFFGVMIEIPFAIGEFVTVLLAYFIRDWRWYYASTTIPGFLFIAYIWILPESIRWLISQNRFDDAAAVIDKVADFNNIPSPKHMIYQKQQDAQMDGKLSVASSQMTLSEDETKPLIKGKKTLLDLLKTPNLRKRSLILFFTWAVVTLVYYGLSSKSGNIKGDLFLNVGLIMLIEIPAYLFSYFALEYLGRKVGLSLVLNVGGLACIICGFLPESQNVLLITLSMIGKFGISAAFAIVYVYAAEVFPTDYRSTGVGACSMCARIGGMTAGYIAFLDQIYEPLPFLVFGILSIISGFLSFLLPETLGIELPQTLKDSEELGSDQSIFYFSFLEKKKKEENT